MSDFQKGFLFCAVLCFLIALLFINVSYKSSQIDTLTAECDSLSIERNQLFAKVTQLGQFIERTNQELNKEYYAKGIDLSVFLGMGYKLLPDPKSTKPKPSKDIQK
jgi:hypothetical protein